MTDLEEFKELADGVFLLPEEQVQGKVLKETEDHYWMMYFPEAHLIKHDDYDWTVEYYKEGVTHDRRFISSAHFFKAEDAMKFIEKLPFFKVPKHYRKESVWDFDKVIYADTEEGKYIAAAYNRRSY